MIGGQRTLACSATVLILSVSCWLQLNDLFLAGIIIPTVAIAGALGARAPFLLHLFFERRGRRPDTNLWRSGAVMMFIIGSVYCVFTRSGWAVGWLSLELNALYAASKFGCAIGECCRQVRHWPRFVPSLQKVEVIISLCIAACLIISLIESSPQVAAMLGTSSHLFLRTFSYWARGSGLCSALSSRHWETFFGLLFLLLGAFV